MVVETFIRLEQENGEPVMEFQACTLQIVTSHCVKHLFLVKIIRTIYLWSSGISTLPVSENAYKNI